MVPVLRAGAIGGWALLAMAAPVRAQLQPEARGEWAQAEGSRVELGGGLTWRAGTYLRAGIIATHDVWRSADSTSATPRVEFALRFTMDPMAQQRWGFSAGGGLGYRQRAYVLAVVELEGPRRSGVRPALQFTLGAGTRLAVILRRAVQGRR